MTLRLLRSFRLRIALLVACVPGVVLIAFASWSWITVERVNMRRIDEQIDRLIHRHVARSGPAPDWRRVEETLELALGSEDQPGFILLVKDREDRVLYRSENWPEGLSTAQFPPHEEAWGPPPDSEEVPFPARPRSRGRRGQRHARGPDAEYGRAHGPPPGPPRGEFFTWRDQDRAWRVGLWGSRRATFALGLDLSSFHTRQGQIRSGLLGAMVIGLGLIAGTGYFIAQRALRPVDSLAATAERITEKGLHERIPLSNEDTEFQRVINVFNAMMERLEKSFKQATRFSADAAHELKTPLTILQGSLERGVQEAEAGSEEQKRYSELLEEVQRLKNITHKLLLLSLVDAGELRLSEKPVDFSRIAEEICEDIAVLAPDCELKTRLTPGLHVPGDPDLLRQVVQNLATNAVQHGIPKGRISVDLRQEGARVLLTVSNTGPAIPEADRDRVFERFHRVDKARSREKGGTGLGLSLAREIARAHGGDLTLDPSPEDTTVFTLGLPGAPGDST